MFSNKTYTSNQQPRQQLIMVAITRLVTVLQCVSLQHFRGVGCWSARPRRWDPIIPLADAPTPPPAHLHPPAVFLIRLPLRAVYTGGTCVWVAAFVPGLRWVEWGAPCPYILHIAYA